MSARLHFVVEGQTEETYVNRVLVPHLSSFSVWGDVRCVMTGRRRGAIRRGGLVSYAKARDDIVFWMKEDREPDVAFTTMFDLYALPEDFPGYGNSRRIADPFRRVALLEEALRNDIKHPRFIPHIQLHEFEALILTDPQKLDWEFIEHDKAIRGIVEMAAEYASPEVIDDGHDSAPSKRIIKEIPEYEGRKASAGPLVAEKIGLPILAAKCRHFADWLDRLKALGAANIV